MSSEIFEVVPANDVLLAQLVRVALGRRLRGTSRVNVSSCTFVVTLHRTVGSSEERDGIEAAVRSVRGVSDVVNTL